MENKDRPVFKAIANHPKVGMVGIQSLTGMTTDEIRDSLRRLTESNRVAKLNQSGYIATPMYKQMSIYE
jgi:predicted transcriptional regulator